MRSGFWEKKEDLFALFHEEVNLVQGLTHASALNRPCSDFGFAMILALLWFWPCSDFDFVMVVFARQWFRPCYGFGFAVEQWVMGGYGR